MKNNLLLLLLLLIFCIISDDVFSLDVEKMRFFSGETRFQFFYIFIEMTAREFDWNKILC